MKNYLDGIVDLTGDSYLNPPELVWDDNEGSHGRDVSKITSISVHHDATMRPHDYDSEARYANEAALHYRTLGYGLQYHFKIDNTGTIFRIRPLTLWLNCVGSPENLSTVAICLDGYFHPPYNQTPTREQYEALGQLLVSLCEEHPEFPATYPDVRPHRDFSSTACPGDLFAPWVLAIQSKADALNIPASAVYDWPEYQDALQEQPQPAPAPAESTPTAPVQEQPPVLPETPPILSPAPEPKVDSLSSSPQVNQPNSNSKEDTVSVPSPVQETVNAAGDQVVNLAATTLGQLVLGVIATGLTSLLLLLQNAHSTNAGLTLLLGSAVTLVHGVINYLHPGIANTPNSK